MVALGLVVAEFNGDITEEMEAAARDRAAALDVDLVETYHVPGAYDTPLAADRLARRDDIDAVVVLGAIKSGDTDHDQVIGQSTAKSLQDVSREYDLPVARGITGPGMSLDEARARTDYGATTVESAVDMLSEL